MPHPFHLHIRHLSCTPYLLATDEDTRLGQTFGNQHFTSGHLMARLVWLQIISLIYYYLLRMRTSSCQGWVMCQTTSCKPLSKLRGLSHVYLNISPTDCTSVILSQMRSCQIPTVRITCKRTCPHLQYLLSIQRQLFRNPYTNDTPTHHQLNAEPCYPYMYMCSHYS